MCDERMVKAESPSLVLKTILVIMSLLAVLPDNSAAQQRTQKVVIAPVSDSSQPGVITTRQQLEGIRGTVYLSPIALRAFGAFGGHSAFGGQFTYLLSL